MTTHRIELENLIHTVRRAETHARQVQDTNNNLLLEHWIHTGCAVEVTDTEADFCLDDSGEFEAMVDEMEKVQ